MKLILKEAVENLGEAGDVITVKPGYARNYLLPQGLAYEASAGNLRRIEEEKKLAEERARRDYLESRRRASQLDSLDLVFRARAGEGDDAKLFGSITNADIADRLNDGKLDFEVDRRMIMLDEPIKSLGNHPVTLRLHGEVEIVLQVQVEREED